MEAEEITNKWALLMMTFCKKQVQGEGLPVGGFHV